MFAVWLGSIAWFGPRLVGVMEAAEGPVTAAMLLYFIVFIYVAWLYGIYNLAIVAFARRARTAEARIGHPAAMRTGPPVALLYTTCDDFDEVGARSCLAQDYDMARVYVLDDSSDPAARRRVDDFVASSGGRAVLVRRADRTGFKAGNLNNALASIATEPYFVTVDADEVLPPDFISRLLPRLLADPACGFIQANHRCPDDGNALRKDMGRGVDIHWRWYQPVRNRYGFVMFLGHGAIIRREAWERVGGFPEIVSEDLAFAIAIREAGWYGTFAADVVCEEQFPETVRAFRVRHVKWTRGTCEFLHRYLWRVVHSRRMSRAEKLDILFPTLNLPLTLCFFVFMAITAVGLPLALGVERVLTVETGPLDLAVPTLHLPAEFAPLYAWDFFTMTTLTILSPVLVFIIEMARTPGRLVRFLAHSTALYATLAPLSAIAVTGYLATGKARFLVTGATGEGPGGSAARRGHLDRLLGDTHPDSRSVRTLEVAAGVVLLAAALVTLQVALVGLAVGYMTIALMHTAGWQDRSLRAIAWVPAVSIAAGFALGGSGLVGAQSALLVFGLHF